MEAYTHESLIKNVTIFLSVGHIGLLCAENCLVYVFRIFLVGLQRGG